MTDFLYKMIDDGSYCLMHYEGNDEQLIIPSEYGGSPVTVLYDDLFKGHKEIRSIEIPDCVNSIGGFVFDGCENLKEITFPSGLLHMWQYAFVRSGLRKADIPGSVKHIIPFTFQDCKELENVQIHEGTEKIFGYAFKGCTALKEVFVPENIEIDDRAFEGCPDVKIVRA